MDGQLLVFEGLDYMGKSSLASKVAEICGGCVMIAPSRKYRDSIRQELSDPGLKAEKRCRLILDGLREMIDGINVIKASGQHVLVDRWKWTTLAYHFVEDPLFSVAWRDRWQELCCGIPNGDKEFLVHIGDESIWKSRMDSRQRSDNDAKIVADAARRSSIRRTYLELNPQFVQIDNSGSLDETVERVMSFIR